MAKARSRKTKIPRKLPTPIAVDPVEREYYRLIRKYALRYIDLVRSGLNEIIPSLKVQAGEELPRVDSVRMDANIEKMIARLFERVGKQLDTAFPDELLSRWGWTMVDRVNKLGKKNIKKTVSKIKTIGTEEPLNVEPLMRDGELSPYFQNVVDQNVGLIKSITSGKEDLFKNQLVSLITQDAPQSQIREAIAKYLSPKTGTVIQRAALIARDQTGKLNGRINQYRQEQLGGKRYIWRTAKDSRVRDDHQKLDGRMFYWNKPPVIDKRTGRRGNPGEDFQCRCYAEMVFEDVVE